MRSYAAANVFSSYRREREAEEEEYDDDEKEEEEEEVKKEEEEEEECTCLHEAEADQFVTEASMLSAVEGTWWNPKDTL